MSAPVIVTPTDHEARAAIATQLDRLLVVDAGAGTGKTRALVDRIVRVVVSGRAPLRSIAAITFTEAAAAELRDRIRRQLETIAATGILAAPDGTASLVDEPVRVLVADAVNDLDDATITTLHGFARGVLADHPLEAGLPPRFAVRDEVQSAIAFEQWWSEQRDRLFDDHDLEPVLVRGLALGLDVKRLRDIARTLHEQWHRLPTTPADGRTPAPPAELAPVVIDGIVDAIAQARSYLTECRDEGDRLLAVLHELGAFATELSTAGSDDARLALLADRPIRQGRIGRKESWKGCDIDTVRGYVTVAEQQRAAIVDGQRAWVLGVLVDRLVAETRAAADARRRAGELDFHDLLVLARNLLCDDAGVRTVAHRRWTHVFVDEFQDTDPLQIEIAVLLAAADPATAGRRPWWQTPVAAGRLFVVGDPKQSIYRFRAADVALYERVLDVYGDARVHLRDNFRSRASILEWVREVFGPLFADAAPGTQVPFEALTATRADLDADADPGPVVALIGGPAEDSLDAIRVREAADVVAVVRDAVARGWQVHRRRAGGRRELAPARLSDIAILLPTRTALGYIERALDDATIGYRVESKSLVFSTAEVREVLAVLAAIDDPTDEVALVAALRSPSFACADDDLLEFRLAGGRWDYRLPPPATVAADHPVARAFDALRAYHDDRRWSSVSELVERVIRECRCFELALAARRPRDRWRRYRFLIDQARGFVANGGRDLRAFVTWAEGQADEGAQVNEVVAPERDDDAVRILTVHGAKGLEFPIVILAGLGVERRFETPPVVWTDGGLEVGIGPFATAGHADAVGAEKAMADAERVRLLYVAATRAEDHLIVSVHHRTRASTSDAARLHAACEAVPGTWQRFGVGSDPPHNEATSAVVADGTVDDAGDVLARRQAWIERRAERLAALGRADVMAATALAELVSGSRSTRLPAAPGAPTAEDADDDGWVEAPDPPRRRGRAGTARGRAVHAVLQTVDLATAVGIEAIARAQADAEGIPDLVDEIVHLARAALAAPVVRAAVAAGRRWRELAVAAPVAGLVIEGFVDLLFEAEDGSLVLVDYKTDRLPAEGTLDREALVAKYEVQLAAYAAAIATVLGRPVGRAVLLFVGAGDGEELEVPDLPAAVERLTGSVETEAARRRAARGALA